MYREAGIDPVFSIALNRDNDTGGVLAFGGLPSGVSHSGDFTSTPIKLMQFRQESSSGTIVSYAYTYYAITVENIGLTTLGNVTEAGGHTNPPTSLSQEVGKQPATSSTLTTKPLTNSTCTGLDSPGATADPGSITSKSTSIPGSTVASRTNTLSQPPGTWWRSRMRRQSPEAIQPNLPLQQRSHVYIVDSGTTLLYVPDELADAINNAFDPPASYDTDTGNYFVDCDAKAPLVSFRINGTDFDIDPTDLILHNVRPINGLDVDPDDSVPCGSGVAAAGADFFVLGAVFLKNVVALFDVGAGEMRFSPRTD